MAALSLLAAVPPAHGRMLLVPVVGAHADDLARVARDQDALLIGRGPVTGSLVVDGDRAALARVLVPRGVAIVAAPAIACGDGVAT